MREYSSRSVTTLAPATPRPAGLTPASARSTSARSESMMCVAMSAELIIPSSGTSFSRPGGTRLSRFRVESRTLSEKFPSRSSSARFIEAEVNRTWGKMHRKRVGLKEVLLIGGPSHAGKSTTARLLRKRTGTTIHSTDRMAKHPGRPWVGPSGKPVPRHVVRHYSTLGVDELLADVLTHYRSNIVPGVVELVERREHLADGLVLEGSALWPPFVHELVGRSGVAGVWLEPGDEGLVDRIRRESNYAVAGRPARRLIDRFVGCALAYNRRMREALKRLGLDSVDIEGLSPEEVASAVIEAWDRGGQG